MVETYRMKALDLKIRLQICISSLLVIFGNWKLSLYMFSLVFWMMTVFHFEVQAFGTVQLFGQNTEHEKITRIALRCRDDNPASCFQKRTLDSLAGSDGTFGAVGAPDPGPTLFRFFAHCSGGDFLSGVNYPRSAEKAREALEICRRYMTIQLELAMRSAASLLNEEGVIEASQTASILPCGYAEGVDKRGKCKVLKHFGSVLHASQDFYAHSNWVDEADPSKPIGRDNPPGLEQRGRAPWLDLRVTEPDFPEGLISGCGGIDAITDGEGGCTSKTGRLRIQHNALNKDNGKISLDNGYSIGAGSTPRGEVNQNFLHAVEAAIDDTVDKWKMLREMLVQRYGAEQGTRMICVLTTDRPEKDCQ